MATTAQTDLFALEADRAHLGAEATVRTLVFAGLGNAGIAGWLCRLPEANYPTLFAVVVRAALYVLAGLLAGWLGVWIYWRRVTPAVRRGLSFRLFALTNAAGWVWVPAVVLLSRQDSLWTPVITVVGAMMLAAGLRPMLEHSSLAAPTSWPDEAGDRELFAQTLRQSKYETYGYWIALLIYAASYALANGSMMMATLLLGPCGFVAAWKLTLVADAFNQPRRPMIAARNRLARVGAAAVVVTACVIFAGVASRNHVTLAASERSDVANKNAKDEAPEAVKWGYESILLWPVPEKKKIIAPVLFHNSEQARGKSEPIVFRFVGTYWYFQPPEKRPGPRAHQAHGTPLLEDIASHNSAPLKMEAHQNLGTEIKLANCGEIQIQVENADNQPGVVSLEVDLIDSTATGKSAISLGEQSLITTEAHHFSIKLAPEEEVVRFAVPKVAKVKKFDEIAVIFMPESRREKLGAKIAVREFRMVPR